MESQASWKIQYYGWRTVAKKPRKSLNINPYRLQQSEIPTALSDVGLLGVRRRRSFRFSLLRAAFHSVVSFTSRFQQIFQSTRIRARHRVAAQLAKDGKIVQ